MTISKPDERRTPPPPSAASIELGNMGRFGYLTFKAMGGVPLTREELFPLLERELGEISACLLMIRFASGEVTLDKANKISKRIVAKLNVEQADDSPESLALLEKYLKKAERRTRHNQFERDLALATEIVGRGR